MNRKIVMKCIFGSHLYGTNTENSDKDYKAIFLPDKLEIFLGKIPKSFTETTKENLNSKNTSEDIDIEYFSLHEFIKLACEGQTIALDMLHCPENMLIETSQIWKDIVKERHRFYTKNLHAFISYARQQAAKYGIKGSRLSDAKSVIDTIKKFRIKIGKKHLKDQIRIKDIWDQLPDGEHIHRIFDDKNKLRMYQVCGKSVHETATVDYALNVFEKYYSAYGKRAKEAAKNKNVDWKAVSHAIRAAYQVKELLTEGTIIFPLRSADFIKKVKVGLCDYLTEVAPLLENMIDEIKFLSEHSSFPESVDKEYWNKFVIYVINEYIKYS